MSMKDTQSKIQAHVWKAIAQSELDLSSIPETDLEILVDTIVDAVVLEIDGGIDQELKEDRRQENGEIDGLDYEVLKSFAENENDFTFGIKADIGFIHDAVEKFHELFLEAYKDKEFSGNELIIPLEESDHIHVIIQ